MQKESWKQQLTHAEFTIFASQWWCTGAIKTIYQINTCASIQTRIAGALVNVCVRLKIQKPKAATSVVHNIYDQLFSHNV